MFICPYANKPLAHAPCEVQSCNFNLDNTPIALVYRRCFLLYSKSLSHNPNAQNILGDPPDPTLNFSDEPKAWREKIIEGFFTVKETEFKKSYADFYTSVFSVIAQDILVSLPKTHMDPLPYRQCVVCGTSEVKPLWYPKGGALPDGWGYCGFNCYQLKPPPLVAMERVLEVDFEHVVKGLDFDILRSRPKFVKNLIRWVLGPTPMT